jgi:putative hemolysin
MKDQPPERPRQSGQPWRRIETNIAMTLGLAITTLVLLGQKSTEFSTQLSQATLMPSAGWYPLLGVLALIILNAVFVAAETSVDLLRSIHVKFEREQNAALGDRLQTILDRKVKYVAACTLASHFCRVGMILTGLFMAPGIAGWLGSQFDAAGSSATFVWALIIVALPIALINLMVELVPKSYAALQPHKVAIRLQRVIRVTSALLSPPATMLSTIAGLLTARFGGRASFTLANQAEEEIKNLVESAQETGEIEDDEKELLHSVFEFSDTVAREVMTPRVDMESMPMTSEPQELLELIRKTGKSRIPLFEGTDDQIVGIVHAKDLLMAMVKSGDKVNIKRIMRPAMFVPENKSLNELLHEMRKSRSEMAIVQDEFGGTSGVITTEDIVEELVGEIVDEYDVEEPDVVKQGDGTYIVHGRLHVDDLNSAIGTELESDEFDTIGGFVFGLFGRQPRRDETIETEGLRFAVVDSDGRRIKKLKVERVPIEANLFEEVGD